MSESINRNTTAAQPAADYGASGSHAHGSYKSYLIGFGLSVVLTVIPFWMVMADVISNVGWVLTVIFVLGAAQILVHIFYLML